MTLKTQGLGEASGINPFADPTTTEKKPPPPVPPKRAKAEGVLGGLASRKESPPPAAGASTKGGRLTSAFDIGSMMSGSTTGKASKIAEGVAHAANPALSHLGAGSTTGKASKIASSVLSHLGASSTLGQVGSLISNGVSSTTDALLNNVETDMQLNEMGDATDNQVKVQNAAAQMKVQTTFASIVANMFTSLWDNIKQMFSR